MPLLSLRTFSLLALILVATAASVRAADDALVQGAKKEGALVLDTSMTLNYVIDDICAGDDFNKNFELFRNVFGAPKS